MDDRCLLFFVKNPEKGKVKTRLASSVGDEMAVKLYRGFTLEMLETLKQGTFPFYICFYPEDSLKVLKEWLGNWFDYMPQRGENLGERMKNGFLEAFNMGAKRVVLIGSDIPDLSLELTEEAFTSLEEKDVVLGPSYDGGYYLIGFTHHTFSPHVFEGIPWSTETVFEKTLRILNQAGQRIHILKHLRDIDTVEDLKHIIPNFFQPPI